MEKAIFVKDLKEDIADYDRLYYGAEFCEHLLPAKQELEGAVRLAQSSGKDLTLVTPFVTEKGLRKIDGLIRALSKKMPSAEVVFNDFGVLGIARENGLVTVMGRLLVKQKNDPRTVMLKGRIPKKAYDYFQRCSIDMEIMQEFLAAHGVERIELDNTLQGVKLPKMKGIGVSLHYPDAYVSTTRLCAANGCSRIKDRKLIRVDGCSRECLKHEFVLSDKSFPVPLIMRGNTQLFENRSKESFRVADRVVFNRGF